MSDAGNEEPSEIIGGNIDKCTPASDECQNMDDQGNEGVGLSGAVGRDGDYSRGERRGGFGGDGDPECNKNKGDNVDESSGSESNMPDSIFSPAVYSTPASPSGNGENVDPSVSNDGNNTIYFHQHSAELNETIANGVGPNKTITSQKTMSLSYPSAGCSSSASVPDASNNRKTAGPGREPSKIIGSTGVTGELLFLIQWDHSDDTELVAAKIANLRWPQMVIKFYEERLYWHKFDKPKPEK